MEHYEEITWLFFFFWSLTYSYLQLNKTVKYSASLLLFIREGSNISRKSGNSVSASLTPQPLHAAPIRQGQGCFTRLIRETKTAAMLPGQCMWTRSVCSQCCPSACGDYLTELCMHEPRCARLLHPAAHLQVVHTQHTALESLSPVLSA